MLVLVVVQMLQQEAYPAIWPPVDAHDSAIPGAIPPQNVRKPDCICGRTAVQNSTPIGKAPTEKSVNRT